MSTQLLGARAPLLAALALAASAGVARAQQGSLAARVAAAPDDRAVVLSFPARPGVCGDGRSYISLGNSTISGDGYFDSRWGARGACTPGPVRVVLARHAGAVDDVRTTVGGDVAPTTAGTTDLGLVDPIEAAAYLMSLAGSSAGKVADRAILPAVLADRAVVWPALLAIARDGGGGRRAPKSTAAFWLSRFAAAARDGHPGDIVQRDSSSDDDGDADVRGRAVFALSQLPRDEGIPGLIEVARKHRDSRVRAKALFWLGQSGNPRAYDLFEQLLAGTR